MQRKHLLGAILALFVSGCVSAPDPVKFITKADEASADIGDVCGALAEIKWSASDADHVSDKLALSLDRVLEMEQEHGCA